jgi:hypothetical protein
MAALPDWKGRIPKEARKAIEKLLPAGEDDPVRYAHRVAGLGSLGRQRFVALAEHAGAEICREAKELAPSAWLWAAGQNDSGRIRYQDALDKSVRAVDPFVHVRGGWIVRRLAPDCTRVELASVPRDKEKGKLLHAMGWETANIHTGSKKTPAILQDLSKRDAHWLHNAAARMVKATTADWEEWRAGGRKAKAQKTRARTGKAGTVGS